MRDKRNYLDFVPVKNPQLPWQADEEGIVTVDVTHRGIAAKVAQVAFNRPKQSKNWLKDSKKETSARRCLVSQVPVRHLRWQMSFSS